MITDRERFLMREAAKSSSYYTSVDEWLKEPIDDFGQTVEQHLDVDAEQYAYKLKTEKVGV